MIQFTNKHLLGLDPSHLVKVEDTHLLLPDVADAYQKMQKAAQSDGHDLRIVSSYRSFERQCLIWNK